MYIQQIILKSISCFDELSLNFTEVGKPCKWVVLLGENGTGKSTVLQMIALSLLGRDMVRDIASTIDWEDFVRKTQKKGRIEITLLVTDKDKKRRRNQKHYRAAFELGPTIPRIGLKQDDDFFREDYEKLDQTLYAEDLTLGWFACGYGVWRRLPRYNKLSGRSGLALTTSRQKPYRFATMLDENLALTVVSDWLVDLEFRRLKEPENQTAQHALALAIQALEKVLIDVKFKEITSEGDVIFEENGVAVSIDRLSDGYRSTTAWVGDLVRRLVDAFPQMKNPLEAQGVVLVDEIDIHLHPKWQRLIVEQIRNLFPNLQFIVTSHSPFVAQDMKPEDKIIVLQKQADKVVAREEKGFVKSWRVDQILTSYLFDLETTRDVNMSIAEKEYERLLDLQAMGKVSDEDQKRLEELKTWIHAHQSPPGETDEENKLYDMTQSFIDILDQYLSR